MAARPLSGDEPSARPAIERGSDPSSNGGSRKARPRAGAGAGSDQRDKPLSRKDALTKAALGDRAIDQYEQRLWQAGFRLIAGVDEAGRGALAGPLVAAAVILPPEFRMKGLTDSKLLTPLDRERWFERIRAEALSVAVVKAFPRRIDARGLHVSNLALLRRASRVLDRAPDFVLCDGFALKGLRVPHLSIKKGDAVTASVAAASVIAKVTRDHLMDRYHRRYPKYGFDRHRGYGTASHRAAIARFGPCPIHRMSFKGMVMFGEDRASYQGKYANDRLLASYGVIDIEEQV
jgi:ribonuclease HII